MEKFCVFCGNRPRDKNREHVLPRWLIALTGDPNRIVSLGPDFQNQRIIQFAFDELTFPACSECNSAFSVLEKGAEQVVRTLLAHEAIDSYDLTLFLDWLDKVRVGMWLGYFYLEKNFAGIEPRFHIIQRLGLYDRMVCIIKLEKWVQGLRFVGTSSRFFQLTPTWFALGINDLYFLNGSGMSLCSQRLGFPYVEPVRIREDHLIELALHRGSERIRYPVERSESLPGSVSIYQPVFTKFVESEHAREFLNNAWVKKHTANGGRGLGNPFLERDGRVEALGETRCLGWLPSQGWKSWEVVSRIPPYIFGRLRRDFERALGLYASSEDRKSQRRLASMARMLDNAMLKNIAQGAEKIRHAEAE